MKNKSLVGLLAAPILGLVACAGGAPAPSPKSNFAVNVAPLALRGIGNAVYTITVRNGATPTPDTVWTETVSSNDYGDGVGALTFIGTCDATRNPHSVTLSLDELYDDNGALLASPGDYKSPGPVTLTGVECRENEDVRVEFNLTIVRSARQGFFDIGVNLKDVFCSAKVDCSPALLHNGPDGRDTTVIVAFACTSGAGAGTSGAQPTWLYLTPLTLTCVDPLGVLPPLTQVIIPSTAVQEGNQGPASPMLFQWAVYTGLEDFQDINKCYWNHALGLDLDVIGPRSCTLTTTGTATDVPLVGAQIPANQVFPVVSFEVEVVDEEGNLCGNNGLDQPGSGVETAYVTPSNNPPPAQFSSAFECGETVPSPVGVSCGGGSGMMMQPAASGPNGEEGITVAVGGVSSAQVYLLPPGATFNDGCCLDDCCQP
jgi:hypothetical protein